MKKMFVAVDYQCDFVCGALGFPGAELLDEGCRLRRTKASSEKTIPAHERPLRLLGRAASRKSRPEPRPKSNKKGVIVQSLRD